MRIEEEKIEENIEDSQVENVSEVVEKKEGVHIDKLYGGSFIERTSVSVDLSGSATTLVCQYFPYRCEIINAYLLYTEASSADAGITVEVGKATDRDYYFAGTTETEKSLWYAKKLTLLKKDIAAGDTITFYSAGGKSGTGEIQLIINYKIISR